MKNKYEGMCRCGHTCLPGEGTLEKSAVPGRWVVWCKACAKQIRLRRPMMAQARLNGK